MRKTIPKFVITAVAFLALPRVYGMEPTQRLNQLAGQQNWWGVGVVLTRRVHTSTRNAIETTLMKENTEEGKEAVIPNNLPTELIRLTTEYTVSPTVYEMANEIQKRMYGPPIEFDIDPSLASRLLSPMVREGKTGLVRMLLEENADANVRSRWGSTPIIDATYYGESESLGLLLDADADVNATSFGKTILMDAAQNGHTDCVGKLLDAGAEVDATSLGWTSLMLAAQNGHKDCVGKLLDAGADVDIEREGLTAVGFAEEAGHTEIATLIQTRIPPEEKNPDNSVIV